MQNKKAVLPTIQKLRPMLKIFVHKQTNGQTDRQTSREGKTLFIPDLSMLGAYKGIDFVEGLGP